MNRVVRVIIYFAWAILSLLVFVYLTFPTEVLEEVVKVRLETTLGPEYRVTVEDVDLAGLTGITIQGLQIRRELLTEGGDDGESGEGESTDGSGAPQITLPTMIDEATLTVNPFTLGGGMPELSFSVSVGEGELFGAVERGEEPGTSAVTISSENVSLLNIGLLSNKLGAAMQGVMTGNVRLDYAPNEGGRPTLSGGQIDLVIRNLVRGPGALSLLFLETPTRMGDLRVVAQIEGSDVTIETFEATGGPDLELQIGGRVSIRRPTNETTLFLTVYAGYAEEWEQENALEGVLGADPAMRQACTDNQCAFALRGRLADRPRPQPLRR